MGPLLSGSNLGADEQEKEVDWGTAPLPCRAARVRDPGVGWE